MGKRARKLLAQKLRMLRMVNGWSQERLAAASGLHRTYISLIERAACNVSLDNLERLADAFGVSVSELLGAPDPTLVGEKLLAAFRPPNKPKER
ncbi:transcriptional regulator [Sulfurifustis variabilis]|uniref:Transcriptional regulator n=1 Tax=Sulfurifustis variabilis TaxID=1675686 RepID=A0A1B4V7K8_9GAMM|nr:helix-turn-helix transcriptional regulator [Sulfurifustis variabilis]BAU49475.1 transcriptional regulator [Sulfurifustis variabilis]